MSRISRAVAFAAATALIGGVAVVGAPVAQAETTPPVLDAVSTAAQGTVVRPGDTIAVSVSAHDSGGAHIGSWFVYFEGPHKTRFFVQSTINETGTDRIVDDVFSATIPRYLEAGEYHVSSVQVSDGQDNYSDYRADGQIWVDGVPVGPQFLDLSSIGFTVDNPGGDSGAPRLADLALSSSTVAAGDVAILSYTASDDLSGIRSVSFSFSDPAGHSFTLSGPADPTLAGIGPAALAIPLAQAGGIYTLQSALVFDNADNMTMYGNGATATQPTGLVQPTPLDLSAVALTVVQPGVADVTAPVLHSVAMVTGAVRHPGDSAYFTMNATDAGTAVAQAYIYLEDGEGHVNVGWISNCDFSSGDAHWWVPYNYPSSSWTVTHVQLDDLMGNSSAWFPDGTWQPSLQAPRQPGGVRFAGLGFTVAPGGPSFDEPYLEPCPETTVTSEASSAYVVPGTTVSLAGGVRKGATQVPAPALAVYATTAGRTSLVGVSKGTSTGSFRRSVKVTSSTKFRSLFLGSSRVVGADPTLSDPAQVHVGSPQTLTSSVTAVAVKAGQTRLLYSRLGPHRGNAAVSLMRWNGKAWVFVTSRRSSPTGVVSAAVGRPVRTTAYRWQIGFGSGYLPARSTIIRVSRG